MKIKARGPGWRLMLTYAEGIRETPWRRLMLTKNFYFIATTVIIS